MVQNILINISNVKFILLVICVSLGFETLEGQKRDYVWTFGGDSNDDGEIIGMQIDFNDDLFNVKQLALPHTNGASHPSICDEDGNLLFYTNGCAVIDREHRVMPNGDNLNDDPWKELLNWDNCDFGYPGIQNEIIIPCPSGDEAYYLIHKPWLLEDDSTTTALWHSYIDMSLNNSRGDVVYKDSLIYNDNKLLFSYLDAIPHNNGIDWWIIQPLENDSLFLTIMVSEEGFSIMDYQNTSQYFDDFRSSASGTSRFSPDGTKYAIYNYYDNLNIYDFDRETGTISNHKKVVIVDNPDRDLLKFGSLEWSPDSRFIYTVNQDSLFQIDTWNTSNEESIFLIDTYDGTTNPLWATFNLQTLGPDCRIYVSSGSSSETFHVIKNPNGLREACNFVQNGVQLPQPHGTTNLPIFPRYRVDAEEKCDSTITSMFGEIVYYDYKLKVAPNPADDYVSITIPKNLGDMNLIMMDSHGKIVLNKSINSTLSNLVEDVHHLKSGVYSIEIIPKNQEIRKIYTAQILIE